MNTITGKNFLKKVTKKGTYVNKKGHLVDKTTLDVNERGIYVDV